MYWYASDLGRSEFWPVSDSTCFILENDEFWNKGIAFFGAKSRCFLPHSHSAANVARYAVETLSFHDSTIRATQWSYFTKNWFFVSNFISIATLKMIHFAVFGANVFSIRLSRKQYKLERWNFGVKDREANDLRKKFSKQCQSFDVVRLQLWVELHLSWAFFNYRSFFTFCLLNNLGNCAL